MQRQYRCKNNFYWLKITSYLNIQFSGTFSLGKDSIACCPIINIALNKDVNTNKSIQDVKYISDKISVSGSFFYNGTINGRDYWLKFGGELAIWYSPNQYWKIGNKKDIGTTWSYIASSWRDYSSACPKESKNYWSYYNDNWISTNVLQLSCSIMGK